MNTSIGDLKRVQDTFIFQALFDEQPLKLHGIPLDVGLGMWSPLQAIVASSAPTLTFKPHHIQGPRLASLRLSSCLGRLTGCA